ncbi:hypothetical protein [Photobacterium phosphoreum]|uniref:hypothetical protein n=1 Tax=Photobacterium phosphoreum TaxID=659 RepID=UPI0024BADC38|nr:hypothetical protein [Photobacterium phosphoreum]
MTAFLDNYGVLISVGCSFLFLLVGWFIVLNGTKYITSRNEARATLNDLNKLLDETSKSALSFWLDYEKKDLIKKQIFYKNSLSVITQIRHYKEILSYYGLDILSEKEIQDFKKLLTLSPSQSIEKDKDKLKQFFKDKILKSGTSMHIIILNNNKVFLAHHKPVQKPFIDKISIISFITLMSPLSFSIGFFLGAITAYTLY